jgi:hypothetical protein
MNPGQRNSKYQNIRLQTVLLKTTPSLRNGVITLWIKYASSTTNLSSAFLKIS